MNAIACDHYNYVKTKAYVKSLKNVFATMCLRSLQLIWRPGFRNLMLFFRGSDHTPSYLPKIHHDWTKRHTSWRRIETGDCGRACMLCASLLKRSIMPARQSGSPSQQCWSNFCIFVDSIVSQIILRMIHESKMISHKSK